MTGPLARRVVELVRQEVGGWPAGPGMSHLESLLRLLAKWRSQVLAKTFIDHHGPRVWGGPFAGMAYGEDNDEGALIARLLGAYESELHPFVEAFAGEGLECVIDVGCAEGYYAVGLARKMPKVQVYAHDINPSARERCAELARKNGVENRVHVGGEFRPQDFQAFADRRTLVFVDAEGAELDVLQPQASPALARMSVIVETHDHIRRGALATLAERFSPTHEITEVRQHGRGSPLPDWLTRLSHLDQLLAVWEWRSRPTPWLVMRPRA